VNPESTADIRKKVEEILNDKSIKEELIKKGSRRAKEFTWDKTAAKTFELYKGLL
jgi:glycosyltransferase involved in cell wall biosynthesis